MWSKQNETFQHTRHSLPSSTICAQREHGSENYHTGRPVPHHTLLTGVCRWLFVAILLLQREPLSAESIPVRYPEGTIHGFLALRTLEGKLLAAGDLKELIHGDQVVSHLVFRFKDGSVDGDTTVFSQRGTFRLIDECFDQRRYRPGHGPL